MELPPMPWSFYSVLIASTLLVSEYMPAHPTSVDFEGHVLRWNIDATNPRITWTVETDQDSSLASFISLTQQATKIWNQVDNSYLVLAQAQTNETPNITIHFDQSIANGDTSAGYAEFDETTQDGPKHCSIRIAAPDNTSWEGLAKTTLHEIGHCFGLGHSLVPESIMSYALDKNTFGLALDDEAAVARLYPKYQDNAKLPAGCSVGGTSNGSFNLWLFLGYFSLPGMLLGLRRGVLFFLA